MGVRTGPPRRRRTGFLGEWDRLVGARGVPTVPRRRGRKPRVPLADVLAGLTFHAAQASGTLGQHGAMVLPDPLSESAWADRRARLPWTIFADLMRRVLRARATRQQADAFWRGWRLIALDGTQFSLANTAAIQ